MIQQAIRNRNAQVAKNIDFKVMASDNLEFPESRFEVVLSRHCRIDIIHNFTPNSETMKTNLEHKSTIDQIRRRFDKDVDRFSE
jgi:hypothetical protein